jgi:hypothetical protein
MPANMPANVPANIRPGLKGLAGTNALAYLSMREKKKSFKFDTRFRRWRVLQTFQVIQPLATSLSNRRAHRTGTLLSASV